MSSPRGYLFIDVETTGLNPAKDLLLEVAVVLTGPGPDFVERFRDTLLVQHDAGRAYEMSSEYVQNMHASSGLWDDLADAGPLDEAALSASKTVFWSRVLRQAAEFGVGLNAKVPLGGQSVHFDRGFLAVEMPELLTICSHQHLDATSVGHFLSDMGVEPAVQPNRGKHRALDDILHTIETLRGYARQLMGTS